MKKSYSYKRLLYIILIFLTIISIFSVAAVCNRCGAKTGTTDEESGKIDVDKTDNDSNGNSSGTTEAGSDKTDKPDNDGEKTKPEITLKVYEGPTYSATDDVCFYRVEATVKGNPAPKVTWSKDDSNNSFGDLKAQVNLTRANPDYTLKATATNSEGTTTATIDLGWGCGGENKKPVITAINLSESDLFIGEVYAATAVATDPDGDDLTYKWTVSGGSIANDAVNPMQWTAPAANGNYTITVVVKDGNGGEDSKDKDVTVDIPLPPAVAMENLPIVVAEGGYIEETGFINAGGCLFAGDSGAPGGGYAGNKGVRGYISFDISHLSGVTITDAELTMTLKQKFGDPSTFGSFYIGKVNWGAEPLIVGDFNLPEVQVALFANIGTGNFVCSTNALKTQLQNAINSGGQRFQIRIHFAQLSDGDNTWDGLEYNQSDIVLRVQYEM